jgi:hypothetical protein
VPVLARAMELAAAPSEVRRQLESSWGTVARQPAALVSCWERRRGRAPPREAVAARRRRHPILGAPRGLDTPWATRRSCIACTAGRRRRILLANNPRRGVCRACVESDGTRVAALVGVHQCVRAVSSWSVVCPRSGTRNWVRGRVFRCMASNSGRNGS